MIKNIIFDFGNVIYSVDREIFLQRISEHTKKPKTEIDRIVFGLKGLISKYETGLLNTDEFSKAVMEECKLNMAEQEFFGIYKSRFAPIRPTTELIKKLKPNYKLGLLSNTNELDFENVIKKSDVFSLFDEVTVSHKVCAMKPNKIIYLDILAKLQAEPEECVFIDDLPINIKAAEELGIKGIHYTSTHGLESELKELDIKF